MGAGDENIRLLERLMGVHIALRGGEIVVESGTPQAADGAKAVLQRLIALSARGERVDTAVVQYAVALYAKGELEQLNALYSEVVAKTFRGRPIRCKTLGQRAYVNAIREHTLTFGIALPERVRPTWPWPWRSARSRRRMWSASCSRARRWNGREAGLSPGDLNQKVDPYLRPLYDAMFDMLGAGVLPEASGAGDHRGGAACVHARTHAVGCLHHTG